MHIIRKAMNPCIQAKSTRMSLMSLGALSQAQMLRMKFHKAKLIWEIALPVETKLPEKASFVRII